VAAATPAPEHFSAPVKIKLSPMGIRGGGSSQWFYSFESFVLDLFSEEIRKMRDKGILSN